MYATVHRVQRDGVEGLNKFLFTHPGQQWVGWPPFLPPENPGQLVYQEIEVTPGGNLVRSYFDILTPDIVHPNDIQAAFLALVGRLGERVRFPQGAVVGNTWFRFDCAQDLQIAPIDEIRVLYGALDEVLLSHWPVSERMPPTTHGG
jgi:hypothetical protein